MAFHTHNKLVDLVCNTKNLKDNDKIIKNSYIFTCFSYLTIGIAGAIGLIGKTNENGGFLVYNYFPKDSVVAFTVECVFLINLVLFIPFITYIARMQFF